MNLFYHPIQFKGYEKLGQQFKYARLTQVVECTTAQADEQDLLLFGFQERSQERVLLYQVPIGHEHFEIILEKYPTARITRSLGYEPLLSQNERLLIEKNLMDIQPIIKKQLVRYNDTLFLDKNGLPIFAQNKLSLTGQYSDQDYRIDLSETDIQMGNIEPILAFAGKH